MMLKERWLKLMDKLTLGENLSSFDNILRKHDERHRHYHTSEHLTNVLSDLDRVRESAESPEEIETALWFHDVIYRPFSSTNEEDSANEARSFLEQNGCTAEFIDRVCDLIMATMHTTPTGTSDQRLITDIDLAILGSDESRYTDFETAVRKEYRWVPYFLYRKKRKEILSSFLERQRIFDNDLLFRELEKNARTNLESAIARL